MPESLPTTGVSANALTVCVMSHTHWDREWYHSAARFRQSLVALVDTLLVGDPQNEQPFLLDGQAVVLEDYLSVRPEQEQQLGARLRSGALEAGPWYVLADGLIPSGEAMVRNLLAGARVLRRFGAVAPAVAYCPDTFGHSHAIPTIAAGFSFPLAIVWRGYGGARWPAGDTVRWQSENGQQVLMYHLSPDGYETGSALPVDANKVRERWQSLGKELHARAATNVVLLPNGADHHALQPQLEDALSVLANEAHPDGVVRESLSGFAKRLVAAAKDVALPIVAGELRDSYGYTWTLGGTFGTRAAQKRVNARVERALLRDVEPWLVLAWLHGNNTTHVGAGDSSISLLQAPALLDAAWRTLLRAHPHDTLCGCSVDAVAQAMDVRLASAAEQARGLRSAAMNMGLRHDVVASRAMPLAEQASVVIRNRAARVRSGVAELLIDETLCDVPVGPSSASLANATPPMAVRQPVIGDLLVQAGSSRDVYRRRESPQHYPDNDLVREHRVLAWVPSVPALGLQVRAVEFRIKGSEVLIPTPAESVIKGSEVLISTPSARGITKEDGHPIKTSDPLIAVPADTRIKTSDPLIRIRPASARTVDGGVELSNHQLRVFAHASGISITRNNRTLANALSFETAADVGDSYTPAIRGTAESLHIYDVRLVASGPLRASARVTWRTNGKRGKIRIRATLILDAESDVLRIDIAGDNQRCDHRLRMNFRTDVMPVHGAMDVWADAAFGPVRRDALNVPAHDQTREMVPPTMPMHRWATLVNSSMGATLHSDGLAEVEANRAQATLSLTLVRAIGELSRANLPERPGHAGWPAPIPMAQSQGRLHARVGLQLHDAWNQSTRDDIEAASDMLLLPLVGDTMRDLRSAANDVAGAALEGVGLRYSAAKIAEDGDGIVLRCVNDSADVQNGSWTLPESVSRKQNSVGADVIASKSAALDPLAPASAALDSIAPASTASDSNASHPTESNSMESALYEAALARIDETPTEPWHAAGNVVTFSAPARSVVTLRVRRRAR